MRPDNLEFDPAAEREFDDAIAWYAERNPAAAAGFVAEVDVALTAIVEAPDRWPAHLHGTRRYRLSRYPYLIVYLELPAGPRIVAVMHAHRLPEYWRDRLI